MTSKFWVDGDSALMPMNIDPRCPRPSTCHQLLKRSKNLALEMGNFDDIPGEIIEQILSRLCAKDLLAAAAVSNSSDWYIIAGISGQ